MVEKYSSDFPKHVPKVAQPCKDIIFVTGTTGGLGAALLACLVDDPKVQRVYAVNRKTGGSLEARQRRVLVERGYDADHILGSGKVILVDANMDGENFGIAKRLYEEVAGESYNVYGQITNFTRQIRDCVTHIIHNGSVILAQFEWI